MKTVAPKSKPSNTWFQKICLWLLCYSYLFIYLFILIPHSVSLNIRKQDIKPLNVFWFHGDDKLSLCCFHQVCVSDEFRGLSKDQIVKLLRSEELRIEDEYQVFTAAMDWVLHDVAKRKKHVVEVLEAVRFPLLSPQRLFKYIEGRNSWKTAPLHLLWFLFVSKCYTL